MGTSERERVSVCMFWRVCVWFCASMIDLCPLIPAPVIVLKKSFHVGHIHITLIFVFCMFRSRPSSSLQPTIFAMPSTMATSPTTASGA